MTEGTDMNQIEKVARAIIGPHEPVPASSRYTLDELREVRWRQITSDERSMALREAKAAIAAMQPAPQWQGIESAPKDRNILVWFDHEADPYQDPQEPHKLTPYAAWAEGGEYLGGKGHCIAKWHPQHFETEDEYGNGYWMPAAWFAYQNGDWEVVCNPTHWMPLPTPPAGGSDAE